MGSKKQKTIDSVEFITPTGQVVNPIELSPSTLDVIYAIADDLLENEDGIDTFAHAVIVAFVIFLSETEGERPSDDMLN